MSGLLDLLFGPLLGHECRRMLLRRWVWWLRLGIAAGGVALLWLVVFATTVGQLAHNRPGFDTLSTSQAVLVLIAVTIALVVSPAVLAGTLSGERNRGSLLLLLLSHTTPREIIAARLAGRLSLVGVMILAGLPSAMALAGVMSMRPGQVLVLIALPLAIGFGAGGLALGSSSFALRGRDALLGVYLLIVALLVAPPLVGSALPAEAAGWLLPLNPYAGVLPLVGAARAGPASATILYWLGLGVLGMGVAIVRLRPKYLVRDQRRRSRRWLARWRPTGAIKNRPMLWKELHRDRSGALSRVVAWTGGLLLAVLLGGSVLLGTIAVWSRWIEPDTVRADWAVAHLGEWISVTAIPTTWLLQWAIALRAAVTVAAEREAGTWDALVSSPLEGSEIVVAKVLGSMRSLVLLVLAVAVAWTLPLVVGAITAAGYASLVSNAVAVSAFVAVTGVWFSLTSETATGAMTRTLLTWVISQLVVAAVAAILTGIIAMIIQTGWLAWMQYYGRSTTGMQPPFPVTFQTGWTIISTALFFVAALAVSAYLKRHFDRLAGRTQPLRLVSVYIDRRPPVRAAGKSGPPAAPTSETGVDAEVLVAEFADDDSPRQTGASPPQPSDPLPERPRHEGTEKARRFWG